MYILELSDAAGAHQASFHLTDEHVQRKAIDVVFDVIGADPHDLTMNSLIAAQDADRVRAIQQELFDEDGQGKFIRENVRLTAHGQDIYPDRPLRDAFAANGAEPAILHARIEIAGDSAFSNDSKLEQFARMVFLHQIAEGLPLEVTVDHPAIQPLLAWAERESLIEIDVKSTAYKLTDKGKLAHAEQLAEAQDLIRRYDIFSDVDADSSGSVHFDTGLGRDLRVPVFEMEGVDPFRARLLIGLNDGEFRDSNWSENALKESWYNEVFESVEKAPPVGDIGKDKLRSIIEQGKKVLRSEIHTGHIDSNDGNLRWS
jgi:hypothetical protein